MLVALPWQFCCGNVSVQPGLSVNRKQEYEQNNQRIATLLYRTSCYWGPAEASVSGHIPSGLSVSQLTVQVMMLQLKQFCLNMPLHDAALSFSVRIFLSYVGKTTSRMLLLARLKLTRSE